MPNTWNPCFKYENVHFCCGGGQISEDCIWLYGEVTGIKGSSMLGRYFITESHFRDSLVPYSRNSIQ